MVIRPSTEMMQAIREYRSGNKQAFDVIYTTALPYLSKCVLNVVNRTAPDASEALVQDILQDTYMSVAEKLDTLQSEEAFFQWAGQIATNHAIRTWSKNSRQAEMEQAPDELLYEIPDEQFIPEDILESKEKQRLIRQMLQELPTGQYLCLVEYFYNGLKETEIAEKLDMPLGTVKTNLFRAKKKLKQIVETHEKKHGVKLYSMSWLLIVLFWDDIKGAFAGTGVTLGAAGAATATTTAAATSGAATAAATAAATGLGAKAIAAVAAVAVVIGSIAGVSTWVQSENTTSSSRQRRYDLSVTITSEMGEYWDGEYTYQIENIDTEEIVASGEGSGPLEASLPRGRYTVFVDAPRHRQSQGYFEIGKRNYDDCYIHLYSDGSWLSQPMIDVMSAWLKYLEMPIGTQDVPSLFVNSWSESNDSLVLPTIENAMCSEMVAPDATFPFYYAPGSYPDFAHEYSYWLFDYVPEDGIPYSTLEAAESKTPADYQVTATHLEQIDSERIRVWLYVQRGTYPDGITRQEGAYYLVVELYYNTNFMTYGYVYSAVCYRAEDAPPEANYGLLEASPLDEDAYLQLIQNAVAVQDWVYAAEPVQITLPNEQMERMEQVLRYTAFHDSGAFAEQSVASWGAFLSDLELEKAPFLKVTSPAESAPWVLIMLAWDNAEPLQVVLENNNSRCGSTNTLRYPLASAQTLMDGIYGETDLSCLTVNIFVKGYNTEISDGWIYQPDYRAFAEGSLTIDKVEKTDDGIRVYATYYKYDATIRCVYEAVENPDSYIGYTLTGVSYSYAE